MSTAQILAFIFGVLFFLLLFGVASFMIFRKDPTPIPPEAMFILRVILALAAGGVAAIVPGFFGLGGNVRSITIQATGAIAVAVLVYLINPPSLIQKERLKKPGKLVKRKRPLPPKSEPDQKQ